jgi:hypothetical protein
MVSAASHLARQVCQWLPGATAEEERVRRAVLRWLRAYPLLCMASQRGELDKLPRLLEG